MIDSPPLAAEALVDATPPASRVPDVSDRSCDDE